MRSSLELRLASGEKLPSRVIRALGRVPLIATGFCGWGCIDEERENDLMFL
jgi:hypothetical protein